MNGTWLIKERLCQDVPGAPNRLDERLGALLINLSAEAPHVNVDQIRTRVEVVSPDHLKQHRPRDRLTRMPDHEFKDAVFGWQQCNFHFIASDLAGYQIDLKRSRLKNRCVARQVIKSSAQQHAHTRSELLRIEGLSKIIITSSSQTAYSFVNVSERAKHQHRHLDTGGTHGSKNSKAIQSRKHPVQRNNVVIASHRPDKAIVAIADALNGESTTFKLRDNFVRTHWIVFYSQYARSGHFPCSRDCADRKGDAVPNQCAETMSRAGRRHDATYRLQE
jgi:hypothetical protein